MTMNPDLSIVIPAFNEEARIAPTLRSIDDLLAVSGVRYEIVVVDDGSADRTVAVVAELAAARPAIRCLPTAPNRGKGHAVRVGMRAARGAVRLMCDADGSIPADQIIKVYNPVATGEVDLALGSRYAEGATVAQTQPAWRRAWSRLVNRIVQRTVVAGIRDTQCGFKAFSADAAEQIFGRARIDGWSFDLEALALADRLGYQIREIAVSWHDDERSRVRPVRDFFRVVREWLVIRGNLRRGVYGLPAVAAVAPGA